MQDDLKDEVSIQDENNLLYECCLCRQTNVRQSRSFQAGTP